MDLRVARHRMSVVPQPTSQPQQARFPVEVIWLACESQEVPGRWGYSDSIGGRGSGGFEWIETVTHLLLLLGSTRAVWLDPLAGRPSAEVVPTGTSSVLGASFMATAHEAALGARARLARFMGMRTIPDIPHPPTPVRRTGPLRGSEEREHELEASLAALQPALAQRESERCRRPPTQPDFFIGSFTLQSERTCSQKQQNNLINPNPNPVDPPRLMSTPLTPHRRSQARTWSRRTVRACCG